MRPSSILALALLPLLLASPALGAPADNPRPIVPASEILAKIERGEPVVYDGVIIVGDLDLSGLDLPTKHVKRTQSEIEGMGLTEDVKIVESSIKIMNSEIRGSVNFSDAIFQESVNFEGTNFTKEAWFSGANINGVDANFMGAKFSSSDAKFIGTNFSGGLANFYEVQFSDSDADFMGASFNGCNANFNKANFSGDNAIFMGTVFGGDADFIGTNFIGDANFRGAEFSNYANFGWGVVDIVEVKINGGPHAPDFMFYPEVADGADFNSDASFEDVKFSGNADFHEAKFKGYANFLDAQFDSDANFWNSKFSGDADFGIAEFSGNAEFYEAKFSGGASFWRGKFSGGNADFGRAEFRDDVYFEDSSFDHANLTLEDARNIRILRLSNATFENESTISLKGTDYQRLYVHWDSIEDALVYNGEVYLTLVKNFKAIEYFEDADDCYYQYRRERQSLRSWGEVAKYTDILGWVTCGYGVRPGYTLLLGLFVVSVSAVYYWRRDAIRRLKGDEDESAKFSDAFYFSMMTFTTVGYGDWYPLDRHRNVVMIEGIVGWLTLSLFLVTLANVIIR